MKIISQGRTTELVETPYFNYILTSIMAIIGIAGFIWVQLELPKMTDLQRDVMGPMGGALGFMGLVGVLSVLITTVKIHSLNAGLGQVSVRKRYVWGAESKPKVLTDLSHVEAELVGGNGPEAYWLKLVFRNGKRKKLRPAAFKPELSETVLSAFRSTLSGGQRLGGHASSPKRGFGFGKVA